MISWIKKNLLGYYSQYKCRVLSAPVATKDGYTYTMKGVERIDYLFWIPTKKVVFKEEEEVNIVYK